MKTQISEPAREKASYPQEDQQEGLSFWRASRGAAWRKLEGEIRRLREENAKLLEEREVLKKSLGILSEVPR